jgi:death-on-curing protein
MIRYLTVEEVLELHRLALAQSGGLGGVLDLGGLDSALAQPKMTFGGQELFPTLAEKAAALGFSLVCNHPFVDGNKRVGHAAMETFLVLNGWELAAQVDEQEQVMLRLAAGALQRDEFTTWVQSHLRQRAIQPPAAGDTGEKTVAPDEGSSGSSEA